MRAWKKEGGKIRKASLSSQGSVTEISQLKSSMSSRDCLGNSSIMEMNDEEDRI
jgi:hypothetical protein